MLSDDTSSDSETGRFKCSSGRKQDEQQYKEKSHRSRRSPDRRQRDFHGREDRYKSDRHFERPKTSRHSPGSRKRLSRDKSSDRNKKTYRPRSIEKRKSNERHTSGKLKHPHRRNRSPEVRSKSREKKQDILSSKSSHTKREPVRSQHSRDSRVSKNNDSDTDSSLDLKVKRSAIHVPLPKPKEKSPVILPMEVESHEQEEFEEIQPTSYYRMLPKEEDNKKESSVTDSSDDERIRAKLLNLERKIDKTKKKKRKKQKKKRSKSKKDITNIVEVSSTTDIQENIKSRDITIAESDTPEVTSTQTKAERSESSEEGEISSDNEDSVNDGSEKVQIDPTDLRHRLTNRSTKMATEVALKDRLQINDACGPVLPPHLEKRFSRNVSPQVEGPALPPHLKNKERKIGPSISSDMRRNLTDTDYTITHISSEDDDAIGPLPVGSENKWTDAHERLEERALDMKIRKLEGHTVHVANIKKREEWMTELPEGKARIIGLEARSFRAKEGPDMSDRSSWTDTPEEKARKAAGLPSKKEDVKELLQLEARAKNITDRDDRHETAVRKHKKKHKKEESLLEMHQKSLKKKKKKEEKDGERQERRPFSRDVDLQVNRFDEAQKKSIIKKAETLNSRFSRGEAKYL